MRGNDVPQNFDMMTTANTVEEIDGWLTQSEKDEFDAYCEAMALYHEISAERFSYSWEEAPAQPPWAASYLRLIYRIYRGNLPAVESEDCPF